MEKRFTDSTLGEIIYTESIFTGRKKITINGKEYKKQSKNVYVDESGEQVLLNGNFYQGMSLTVGGNTYQITEKLKWYDYLAFILPILFNIIWGNSVTLCKIIPIIGGAIGAFVCGLFGAWGLVLMKKCAKAWQKAIVFIGAFALSVLICYLLALVVLAIF